MAMCLPPYMPNLARADFAKREMLGQVRTGVLIEKITLVLIGGHLVIEELRQTGLGGLGPDLRIARQNARATAHLRRKVQILSR